MTAHLWPTTDGAVSRAKLTGDGWDAEVFYERVDQPFESAPSADPLLVGTLLAFMTRNAGTVRVHGAVSRTLLRNLDELQHVWLKWRPDLYSPVSLEADDVVEDVIDEGGQQEGAISAFSGGVDAAFTAYRHAVAAPGWHTIPLREVVMIQGFDIGLDEPEVFQRAVERAGKMLTGTELRISRVRTNLRELWTRWGDNFALGVASALLLFSDRRSVGLIGSSEDYGSFVVPCGSTPVQDWMASTCRMQIRNDGAGFSRTEKLEKIADWPAALEYIRVCYRGVDHDRNCGHCEKCVRTMLNLRLVGVERAGCFENDFDPDDLRRVYFANGPMGAEWRSILAEAGRRGIDEPWVADVRRLIRRERLKATGAGQFVKRLRNR